MSDKVEFKGKLIDPATAWGEWFSGSAFAFDKRLRRIFQLLPHDPRCKFCSAPFQGIGGALVRAIFHKQQSTLNPRFCNLCEEASRRFPGGSEVEMAILFADVRGSTALSEQMSPTEFSQLINRFYTSATNAITSEDGLVEKLAGDAVTAFWGAGFAGPDYVARTLKVARNMQRLMARQNIPVGIGVHAGVAFFGAFGTVDGLMNISVIGDEVNLTARLASKAEAGEIIASEQMLRKAGADASQFEPCTLELKGIAEPVRACIIRA